MIENVLIKNKHRKNLCTFVKYIEMEKTLSITEENYLKALFNISYDKSDSEVGTNELASQLDVKPATVNNMLKKLKEKKLVNYEKYGKIKLTSKGKKLAIGIVRKHRLWETFLYEKLDFNWDEIHEIAEQLEHIQSTKLMDKLDKYLNYPQVDPHGDPIPTVNGELIIQKKKTLSEVETGKECKLIAVKDNSSSFLNYLLQLEMGLNDKFKLISKQEFDGSFIILFKKNKLSISQKFAENIFVI